MLVFPYRTGSFLKTYRKSRPPRKDNKKNKEEARKMTMENLRQKSEAVREKVAGEQQSLLAL